MKDRSEVDERARDYFRYGSNGSELRFYWDSECGAPTSPMIIDRSTSYCVFCGERGLPLQPWIKKCKDYSITGYTCICKDALDYLDILKEEKDLRDKMFKEIKDIRGKAPSPNKEVIHRIVKKRAEAVLNNVMEGWSGGDALEGLGVHLPNLFQEEEYD